MYNLALLNCEQDIDLKMDFMNIIDLCTAAKKPGKYCFKLGSSTVLPQTPS